MEIEAEVSLNPLRISLFYGNMLTLVQARTKSFLFEFLQLDGLGYLPNKEVLFASTARKSVGSYGRNFGGQWRKDRFL